MSENDVFLSSESEGTKQVGHSITENSCHQFFCYITTVPGCTVRSCHAVTCVKFDPPLIGYFLPLSSWL